MWLQAELRHAPYAECCIFHRRRRFGDWSDDEDSDKDSDTGCGDCGKEQGGAAADGVGQGQAVLQKGGVVTSMAEESREPGSNAPLSNGQQEQPGQGSSSHVPGVG